MREEEIWGHVRRIDEIHSVSGMMKAVKQLDPLTRRAVILHALKRSRFQFQWSSFATDDGIPKSEWPEQVTGKAL